MKGVNVKIRHRNDVKSGATYVYLSGKRQAAVLEYAKKFLKMQHKYLPFEPGEIKIYDTNVDVKLNSRGRFVPVNFSMTIRF